MKKKFIILIFFLITLFILIKPAHALSVYRFPSIESQYDYFLNNGVKQFYADIIISFIWAIIEFIVLAALLFKKDFFKIKKFLIVFSTNIFTWLLLFGTSVISAWYLLLISGLPILLFHPLLNYGELYFIIFGIFTILLESFIFVKIFKKEYTKNKIIFSTVVANLLILFLSFFIFGL